MNSLIEPSVQDLLKKVDNRYRLVTIAARRARQIIAGHAPLVDSDSIKPLTIAVNEINENAVKYENIKDGVK